MTEFVNALAGASLAIVFSVLLWRGSVNAIIRNGHMAIVVMVAIYLGAHLSNSAVSRQLVELCVAVVFIALSKALQVRWPAGVGFLIIIHGMYDLFFGPSSGIASWYPAACAGFDMVAGIALMAIVLRKSRVDQQS
jgi:hypothetical protein